MGIPCLILLSSLIMILTGAGKQIARLTRGGWSKTMHTYSAARSIHNNPFSLCCLSLSFSLCVSHPTQYRYHDDIQFKKDGRKREKNTWKRKQAWRCNKHKSVPFTTSLQALPLFCFISYRVCTFLSALEHVAVRK